jgi:hypothetical protein
VIFNFGLCPGFGHGKGFEEKRSTTRCAFLHPEMWLHGYELAGMQVVRMRLAPSFGFLI